MNRLKKIDTGWYEAEDGTIFQKWETSIGAPKKKAGWYVWFLTDNQEEPRGPFNTLRDAINNNR